MAKTETELNELKERLEDLEKELDSLSDEELEKVTGGAFGHGYVGHRAKVRMDP